MKPHFDQLLQSLEQITQQLTMLEGVFSLVNKTEPLFQDKILNDSNDDSNETVTDQEQFNDLEDTSNALNDSAEPFESFKLSFSSNLNYRFPQKCFS